LRLMLKPSQGPSRSGAQAIFGTRAGATIGMGGVATTTGGEMDPTPMAIVVDLVVLAIMVDLVVPAVMVVPAIMVDLVVPAVMVVLAIMVVQVVLAVTADPLIAAVN
jgi:hypothetical protein